MFVGVQTNEHLLRMSSPGKSPPANQRQSEAGDTDSPLVFLLIGTAWCIKQIARAVSLAARSTLPYLSALRLLARPAPSSADLQDFTRVALQQDNALARAMPPQPLPPPVAAHSLPLHALSGTRKLLREIKEHHHTDAKDITERLARSRPSPWSPLRWLLGGQVIVEGLFPRLHEALVQTVQAARKEALARQMHGISDEIDQILEQGGKAEDRAGTLIEEVRKAAASTHPTWRPFDDGIACTVMPPDEHSDASHEFDDLLLTPAGLYVIEVKGWRDIEADGGHKAPAGTRLKPAHRQSKSKVERLRRLLGENVPVHSLVLLPNLSPAATPLDLDARYIVGSADLSLTLRQHLGTRKRANHPLLDITPIRETLLVHIDRRVDAKVHHMIWLAERFPSDGPLKVRKLYGQLKALESQPPLLVPPVDQRPLGLVLATAIPLAAVMLLWHWIAG